MNDEKKYKNYSVRLNEEIANRLEKFADEQNKSIAQIMRESIKYYLDIMEVVEPYRKKLHEQLSDMIEMGIMDRIIKGEANVDDKVEFITLIWDISSALSFAQVDGGLLSVDDSLNLVKKCHKSLMSLYKKGGKDEE